MQVAKMVNAWDRFGIFVGRQLFEHRLNINSREHWNREQNMYFVIEPDGFFN